MAEQTVVTMNDDIDGSQATQTVEFSYRRKSCSVDLDDSNAANFDDALAPYISAVEPAGGARSSRSSSGTTAAGRTRPTTSTRRQFAPGPRPMA